MQVNEEKYIMIKNGIPVSVKQQNGRTDIKHASVIDFNNPENNYFVMLSNGEQAKVGTLGSKFEFFHEWKRLDENDEGNVELATMLKGMCEKGAFIDLLENFIIYDHENDGTKKILARNHQYLGVNKAVKAWENRKLNGGKLGVFWHTQGSGKSYSMLFLSQKIRRKYRGSPTIVILTDIEPVYPDHDILIISDEAHRSQYGIFAENMTRLLPSASRIGFTGTPLLAYDNITERTFGGYISVYDFKRAVEDGATVPLYYENRALKIKNLQNPEINDKILDAIERADLDPNQQERLERNFAREIHLLTAEERLDAIAEDFVQHYSDIWTSGKAMFVCLNKVTCVRMYNLVQKHWRRKIDTLHAELSETRNPELERKLNWMRETEMAVVISQEQNEIQTFNNWGLDIRMHREKMEKRELDKEFKDKHNYFPDTCFGTDKPDEVR